LFVFTLQVQFQGLFQMILVLGIGGSFPYGFHISVINYPSHIRKFINETWIERHGSPLHPETIMLLWSFIVSVYGIGGFLGSLCCGYLTTKYRKKKCQMFTNLIMLVAALLMAFSKTAKSFEMILAGRFLYGVGTGFSLNIHPQYVGEISPKKLRGFTNSTVAVFLTLGKLTGQVVGLRRKILIKFEADIVLNIGERISCFLLPSTPFLLGGFLEMYYIYMKSLSKMFWSCCQTMIKSVSSAL
uniref:Major facilitator superfamily (MFS) profile domain-containing protein n=1 Tax=Anas zonorhyncha TaxID=75864 RepID=A0A8B9VZ25_9AVES